MSKLSSTPTPDLENGIAEIEEQQRQDKAHNERRDWHAEAATDGVDSDEVLAERTLFNARCKRREKRLGELNAELRQRQRDNVEGKLAALEARHGAALGRAEGAAGAVDVEALDALEAQISAYLSAVGEVRSAAVNAGQIARENDQPAPGLNSVKSERVEALYSRLTALADTLTGPSANAGRDLTFYDVKRVEMGAASESSAA